MQKHKIWGFCSSGGGSTGAWGGGVSEFLVHGLNRNYKHLSGTSTGALLMNMVAYGDMTSTKSAYTSVTNKDIYKLSPYRVKNNNNGVLTTKMNYFKIGWNILIRKQKTFGDSTKLRTNILPKFFTPDTYAKIKENKELIACVTNLTLGCTELKSSNDYEYEDFLDWIFASTCAAPFMSIVEKDKCEYADGGYIEHIPIQILIDRGCTEIDIIDLKSPNIDIELIRNSLHLVGRLADIMMWKNAINDLYLAKLKTSDKDVILNVYSPGRKLTNNSLVFDKKSMSEWWDEGYKIAQEGPTQSYVLRTGSKRLKKM